MFDRITSYLSYPYGTNAEKLCKTELYVNIND